MQHTADASSQKWKNTQYFSPLIHEICITQDFEYDECEV